MRDDGAVVCERCRVADTPWRRLKGLLGRSGLEPGEGLLIRPTNSIHMFFMRFPIDAVFIDRDLRVVYLVRQLEPWRVARKRGAKAVLELPAGEATRRGLAIGQSLELAEKEGDEPSQR